MYYYKTPIDYLLIEINEKGLIIKASFDTKKGKALEVIGEVKKVLDDYFEKGTLLPKKYVDPHVNGTPFQKSVWKVIESIPFGKTATYKELAEKLGNPNASRAFGTACGKNPVALFIPCHRVVRSSGEDFGYSWGKERKEWLLKHESAVRSHS